MQKAPKKRKQSSDYQIGYGRPPRAAQFKKGVSGNKKGRPKGSNNIATLFHAAMYERVVITENGQRRTISKIEAALKQLTNKAAAGDPKAIQAIFNVARELGDLKLPDPLQAATKKRFTLSIFAKDPVTGELARVNPPKARDKNDDAAP